MIDSHAHLTDKRYGGGADIINSMSADGLEAIVTIGYDTESSRAAAKLAAENENIYAAIGIHPTEFTHESSLDGVLALAGGKRVVAYGEIGLDYYWDEPGRDIQKNRFELQLDAAVSLCLPIIVHSRDCDGDMLLLLKKWHSKIKNGLVMHCFSSSAEFAREYVKLGFHISFAGPVTYKNAKRGDAIREVPSRFLLAETDCPYLTPQPRRGKLNYPAYVRYVIEKLAEERGSTFEEIERITTANAKELFGIR